jgi:hypothetical protein
MQPGTVQNSAIQWVLDQDLIQLCPEDSLDIIQRYVLALFYYSLNGGNWTTCGGRVGSDCEGLPFLSENSVCDWHYVTCTDGTIVQIDMGTSAKGTRCDFA